MLSNNDYCTWSDFTQEIEDDNQLISDSTLSIYLKRLRNKNLIDRPERDHYVILPKGKKRFFDLSKMKKKEKSLSYPPEIIKKDRNYDHWILWMLYNNNSCKWSDFTEEPLRINQSSLSKNINLLLDSGMIRKENKKYKITQKGKIEYSQMLSNYDLDRQSILDEESKRIDEIIQKTKSFFNVYGVKDRDIKYRFLNYNLKMNYAKLQTSLEKEEDFFKILLFFASNHPDAYPKYISPKEFSEKYNIEKIILDFHILQIVDKEIFPIKYFKLNVDDGKIYYLPSEGKLEKILRSIVDDYIYKFTYLRKLDEYFMYDINDLVEDILHDICGNVFHADLKNALHEFIINNYIQYLTYEIETKKQLTNVSDKLEGYSYQTIQGMFQQNDLLNDHYQSKTNAISYLYPEILKVLASYYKKNVKEVFEKCEELFYDHGRDAIIEDIIQIIDDKIEEAPDVIALYILKAIYYAVYIRSEAALKILKEDIQNKFSREEIISKDTSYVLVISFIQCFAHLLTGDSEEAINISENVFTSYPNHPISHLIKALIYGYNTIYKWFSETSSLDIFLKEIDRAIALDNNILNKSRYHQLKANIFFLLKDYKNAFEAIDSAIALKDNILDYYYNKIHGLTMSDKFENAIHLIEEVSKQFPDKEKILMQKKAFVYFKWAEKQEDITKNDFGIDILKELAQKYPEDYNLLNSLAYGYSYNKNEEKAFETLKKLISLDPTNGNYYDSYGEILQNFERYEEAIEKYKKSIELDPEGFYLYQTFPRIGECYYHLGEYDLAKQNFEKGLETISTCACENEKKEFWDKKARDYLQKLRNLD